MTLSTAIAGTTRSAEKCCFHQMLDLCTIVEVGLNGQIFYDSRENSRAIVSCVRKTSR